MAESKVIGAEADVDSAQLMKKAAAILKEPAAMQIRYLEALTSLSNSTSTPKVIFFPSDFNQLGTSKVIDVVPKK